MNELSPEKLNQVLEYINENLAAKISLETLANHVEISLYYFSRLFKESMGVPPYQYILQQRIERAKQLLKTTDLSITEIALECGFANQSHLAKKFRSFVGMTPSTYREL